MTRRSDFELSAVVRPNILALKPYRCARDDYSKGVLLDANENSFGPAVPPNADPLPSATAFVPIDYSDTNLERYPDPRQVAIKKQLCDLRHVPSTDHFFLGVGSDEAIDLAIRIFCRPGKDKILICPPTYGMYSVCAQVNDVEIVKVPLNVAGGSFQLQTDKVLETLEQDPLIKIVFLCSPGNPTGTLIAHSDVKRILDFEAFKGIVLVDEAYIDFCGDADGVSVKTIAPWVAEYPNLIVTQTLSKAFGLAGIRLGISISSKEIAQIFNNTKAPYNICTPTSLIARAALSEAGLDTMREHVEQIAHERTALIKAFKAIPRLGSVLGGNDANFVLVPVLDKPDGRPDNTAAVETYKRLAEVEGVVVRFRGNELGCEGCLRITIGTPMQNNLLLSKLKLILG